MKQNILKSYFHLEMTMHQVDWTSCAEQYDLMAENNPAYQDLLARCRVFLREEFAAQTHRILDVGAGTGNFSLLAAKALPAAQVVHLEPNVGMNRRVHAKAKLENLSNLIVQEKAIEEVDFPAGYFDLIIGVHAFYIVSQPREQLHRIFGWLRSGGWIFLCDLGRTMDLNDWGVYLFNHLRQQKGLIETIRLFWRGRQVARHNRHIASLQLAGKYWLHSSQEFREAVETIGFRIKQQELAYRGFSDLIIAQKP